MLIQSMDDARSSPAIEVSGLRKAFAYPEGWSPPPLFVLILNVVVDQAEVVTELNGRCARDGTLPIA